MEPNWRFAKRVPHPSPSSLFSQAPRMQENARNTNKSRLNSMEFRARLEGPGEGGEESTITRNYLRPGRPSDLEISSRERSAPGRAGQRPGRTRQDIHGVLNHPPLHELLGAQDPKPSAPQKVVSQGQGVQSKRQRTTGGPNRCPQRAQSAPQCSGGRRPPSGAFNPGTENESSTWKRRRRSPWRKCHTWKHAILGLNLRTHTGGGHAYVEKSIF